VNKGLIFDIRRFSVHDGPGIRTTVFLKGCPLSCWWCHNPESRSSDIEQTIRHRKLGDRIFDQVQATGTWMTPEEVCREVFRDMVFYNESSGGVTFSGGEPLMQFPFLKKTMAILKENGIHITVDTCGYALGEEFVQILDLADLFLYDLKIMDEQEHIKYSGVSNNIILSNLQILYDHHKNVIIRYPVIPGINDSNENIEAMKSFLMKLADRFKEIDLLPYHTLAQGKYYRFGTTNRLPGLDGMKKEDLLHLKQEFESVGFSVKIGG
jgi:pyruvate formate lyase activating enzyme